MVSCVLKVMKLAIWRIDVQAKTVSFESDFRDVVGAVHFPPNTPLEEFYDLVLPQYRVQIQHALKDLVEGRIDEAHVCLTRIRYIGKMSMPRLKNATCMVMPP